MALTRKVDFPARALALVAGAALAHFAGAALLVWTLAPTSLPSQRATLSISVLLTTLTAVAILYFRTQYSSAQHVARSLPRTFLWSPPLFVACTAALTFPAELFTAHSGWWPHALTPVIVSSWVPALLLSIVLAPALQRMAARTPYEEPAVGLQSFDPPRLPFAFGRILALSALAVALFALATVEIVREAPFPVTSMTCAWLGVGASLLLAAMAGMSLGQSPGEDVVSIAHRLDALGYGPTHDDLAAPVVATSADEVGELFARLEDLRERLVDEMDLYEEALAKTRHADALKAEFLSAVSHELRTPLNAIGGFAQLLLEELPGTLTEAQAEDLRLVQAGARQLLGLINDILDLSMIESGELRLAYGPVDLAEVIHEVVRIHQPQVRGRPVRLSAEVEPELPNVVCDERRLRQILTNLVSNAVKFTERGTITVRAAYDGRHDGVVIRCIDTGIGIDAADLVQIFEEYRQAGSPKRRTRGTGLGLAIARRIAIAHGGSLTVESTLGEGSTFTLCLPFDPPHRPATIDMAEEVARFKAEASAQAKILPQDLV